MTLFGEKHPRAILLLALIVIILLMLPGCSKRGICDECGQEASLNKYVKQGKAGNAGNAGEVVYLCDDCLRIAKFMGE